MIKTIKTHLSNLHLHDSMRLLIISSKTAVKRCHGAYCRLQCKTHCHQCTAGCHRTRVTWLAIVQDANNHVLQFSFFVINKKACVCRLFPQPCTCTVTSSTERQATSFMTYNSETVGCYSAPLRSLSSSIMTASRPQNTPTCHWQKRRVEVRQLEDVSYKKKSCSSRELGTG